MLPGGAQNHKGVAARDAADVHGEWGWPAVILTTILGSALVIVLFVTFFPRNGQAVPSSSSVPRLLDLPAGEAKGETNVEDPSPLGTSA